MRLALLQLNPTIGDLDGNADRIRDMAASVAGVVDVIVTPEMAVTGYPPRDLLLQPGFIADCEATLVRLAAALADGPPVLVGAPRPSGVTAGRPLVNAAVLLRNGRIAATHAKSLLPTYDVFDEDRYFEPGRGAAVIDIASIPVGVSICEDVWFDSEGPGPRRYDLDPMMALDGTGVRVVVNMSASPYAVGKLQQRQHLLGALARRHDAWVVYANQVGANDDLVFDGRSLAVDPSGACVAQAAAFREDILIVDTDTDTGAPACSADVPPPPVEQELYQALVLGVRDYARKCGFTRAVLGLSGGIDSALTAVVAVDALGPANVTGILMPSAYSSQGSLADAEALAAALGMPILRVPIAGPMQAFDLALAQPFAGRQPDVTEENIQARIRGTLLMAWSNKMGDILLTTGNKSELATGYCTLYGDMNGALAVIADLYKTQVYALARWVNRNGPVIPASTITKPPSAELRPNQTDQDSLPPYDELDALLTRHIEGHADRRALIAEGFAPPVVDQVLRLVRLSEFKRKQAAPALKVSTRAFGTGWRMPIARSRWI
jgi:NAD+ synthase (glutamine-hydrolysing)